MKRLVIMSLRLFITIDVKFLKSIDLYCTLEDFGITKDDIESILKHAMEFPDSR